MLLDPVPVKLARNFDNHLIAVKREKLGLAEPGVITLLGNTVFYQ